MDSLFEELVAVNSGKAFRFFLEGLKETAGVSRLRDDEVFYVASILAHYAQTPGSDATSIAPMADLSDVFDNFVFHNTELNDSELLEIGGSQILLFAGFFRDQMAKRHNVKWYDQVGQSLYERASQYSRNAKKRVLFDGLAETLPDWTIACRDLSRSLRANRLLLKIN
jgi:hypothetical protein